MQPILNKWQLVFSFNKAYEMFDPFIHKLKIGLIKIHTLPEENNRLRKNMYKGYVLKLLIRLPIAKE